MAKTQASKRWTIMIYLCGDSSLDAAGIADVTEMKQVGSSADINVLAQVDRAGSKSKTTRYYLQKGTSLAKDAVQSLGETNMGDPRVLADFLTWGIKNYPADHYMVVLWNHGAGWDDSNIYTGGDAFGGAPPPIMRKGIVLRGSARAATRGALNSRNVAIGVHRARRALFASTVKNAVTRGIAFDDEAKDFLDNVEMKRVLMGVKKVLKRKIDILGFDACLMSMAEVAYQVKDAVNFSVGSEETEPNEGWPYNRVLKALAAKPAMTPRDLAAIVVTQYLASYGTNENVTQAAADLSQLDGLAAAIDKLAKALRAAMGDSAVHSALMTARAQVQEYEPPYDEYCDLVDLCSLISHHANKADITTACDGVKAAVAKAVINAGAKGKAVANSHGLSIYFPKKKLCSLYATLDFAKKNAWSAFLADYVASTSRRPALG